MTDMEFNIKLPYVVKLSNDLRPLKAINVPMKFEKHQNYEAIHCLGGDSAVNRTLKTGLVTGAHGLQFRADPNNMFKNTAPGRLSRTNSFVMKLVTKKRFERNKRDRSIIRNVSTTQQVFLYGYLDCIFYFDVPFNYQYLPFLTVLEEEMMGSQKKSSDQLMDVMNLDLSDLTLTKKNKNYKEDENFIHQKDKIEIIYEKCDKFINELINETDTDMICDKMTEEKLEETQIEKMVEKRSRRGKYNYLMEYTHGYDLEMKSLLITEHEKFFKEYTRCTDNKRGRMSCLGTLKNKKEFIERRLIEGGRNILRKKFLFHRHFYFHSLKRNNPFLSINYYLARRLVKKAIYNTPVRLSPKICDDGKLIYRQNSNLRDKLSIDFYYLHLPIRTHFCQIRALLKNCFQSATFRRFLYRDYYRDKGRIARQRQVYISNLSAYRKSMHEIINARNNLLRFQVSSDAQPFPGEVINDNENLLEIFHGPIPILVVKVDKEKKKQQKELEAILGISLSIIFYHYFRFFFIIRPIWMKTSLSFYILNEQLSKLYDEDENVRKKFIEQIASRQLREEEMKNLIEELDEKKEVMKHVQQITISNTTRYQLETQMRNILPMIAFYLTSGPWRGCWVRRCYDPRKTPNKLTAIPYQIIDYRTQRIEKLCNLGSCEQTKAEVRNNLLLVTREDFSFTPNNIKTFQSITYQLCDIHVPLVQHELNHIYNNDLFIHNYTTTNYCRRSGWLTSVWKEKVRQNMFDLHLTFIKNKENNQK
ncbi:hypothetical protein SNEBB_011373 [Seison nebaliae]|nr:hypothetical protein SNEBB_011373 [Seison nebaliae]